MVKHREHERKWWEVILKGSLRTEVQRLDCQTQGFDHLTSSPIHYDISSQDLQSEDLDSGLVLPFVSYVT